MTTTMWCGEWNKALPLINGHAQPVGRPLTASEAQQAPVLKQHKAGKSLRWIAEETWLGPHRTHHRRPSQGHRPHHASASRIGSTSTSGDPLEGTEANRRRAAQAGAARGRGRPCTTQGGQGPGAMSGYRLDVTVMFSFGTIVYTDLYGEKYTTSWKHRVVREGKVLKTYALPGGYSSEWEA